MTKSAAATEGSANEREIFHPDTDAQIDAAEFYGVFDGAYYLAHNPDIAVVGINPLQHYLNQGWKEQRNPSAKFNTAFYLDTYRDVAASGMNPLVHYLQYGKYEGRLTQPKPSSNTTNSSPALATHAANSDYQELQQSGLFDKELYLQHNRDVATAGIDPLEHYLNWGWKEQRNPSARFNTAFYLQTYTDAVASGINPLLHYLRYGRNEGRLTQPKFSSAAAPSQPTPEDQALHPDYWDLQKSKLFDADFYLQNNDDVAIAGIDPLQHYLDWGWKELRDPSEDFSTAFYLETHSDVAASDINPLLHYLRVGKKKKFCTQPPEALIGKLDPAAVKRAAKVIAASGLFDQAHYLLNNAEIARKNIEALEHYIRYGWKELRNPSSKFDVIWYTQNYLGGQFVEDPLLHYIQTGRALGHLPKPRTPCMFSTPFSYAKKKKNIRRICLFAGYDTDGIVDDYVLEYLRDLSRHADIYYLADGQMPASELAKLNGVTKKAWAVRHAAYDFGSWSKLAKELVGWDVIASYDELIFANDSCYQMRPLADVFETMDTRACDWWGLQATKGIAKTFAQQALPATTPLTTIKSSYLDQFENDGIYDFLVGSYFLVFRKPVLSDTKFQDLIGAVQVEPNKLAVVRKYEIGTTRWLISAGYSFDTFVPDVYPRQPIFTDTAFDLIAEGFPLFKRYFLSTNHYGVEGLAHWKQKLRAAGIEKDLSTYESNLLRVSNNEELYRSLDSLRSKETPPLSIEELEAEDLHTPKYDHWWAFPVCGFNHLFSDNIRALFESVKNDPSIKKIVLTRSKHIRVSGKNVVVVPLKSREGQFYLVRSRQIFLKHTVKSNVGYILSSDLHNFYDLWHGIPLKKIHYTSLDQAERLATLGEDNRALRAVIAASPVDRLAMTAAFWPLTYHDVWVTGLPRHDFITCRTVDLPEDMKGNLDQLDKQLAGRKLVLFVPTFKNNQSDGYYSFTTEEVATLTAFLTKNKLVMGVREHMADRKRQYSSQLVGDCFIDLSEKFYPHVEVLYRQAAALITDYSSSFIDFLLTRRPVISFAYDFDHYSSTERGLFYDMEWAFPGDIAKTFSALMQSLKKSLNGLSPEEKTLYDFKSKIFLEFNDSNNSRRVYQRVVDGYKGSTSLFDLTAKPLEAADPKQILWIYQSGDEENARRRIFDVAEQLERGGWKGYFVESSKVSVEDFATASIAILSRVQADDRIIDLCEGFRAAGRHIIADIDNGIFDAELIPNGITHEIENNASPATSSGLRGASTADHIIVSTPALRAYGEKFGRQVTVVRSTATEKLVVTASKRPATKPPPTKGGVKNRSTLGENAALFENIFSSLQG